MSQNRWEEFARADAEWYILTEDHDYSTEEGMQAFFRSGQAVADSILADVGDRITRWDTALEIGCGVGRLTLPMSRRFSRVLAVDVAPSMLHKLERNATTACADGIEGFLPEGAWDKQGPVDFAYSSIVFQHIEDYALIDAYIARIAGCLRPGGITNLHFDTRPKTPAYWAVRYSPDGVLPKPWRRGIRRVRRTSAQVAASVRNHGLRIVQEIEPGSANHRVLATRD